MLNSEVAHFFMMMLNENVNLFLFHINIDPAYIPRQRKAEK
jgi:hypothetical protein